MLKDANIEAAPKFLVIERLYNNGETCISTKWFIVTDKVYDAFVNASVAQMKAITVGDPTDANSQLRPLSSKAQFDMVKEQVDISVAKWATVLCGGKAPDRICVYNQPTILANLTPGMPAYDDEIFGPVASIIRAKDDDDAICFTNKSRYGLGGRIFSKDEDSAFKLARDHFETGMIRINTFGSVDPNMPFGCAVFDAVLPLLNPKARIPVCGLISQYNATALPAGPDLMNLLLGMILRKRMTVRVFLVFNDFGHL